MKVIKTANGQWLHVCDNPSDLESVAALKKKLISNLT